MDGSEVHNLAAEEPGKLRELVGLWFAEAGRNLGFPLDDRSALEIFVSPAAARHRLGIGTSTFRIAPKFRKPRPSMSATDPFRSAPWSISQGPARRASCSPMGPFRRPRSIVKDNHLHYAYNFVGLYEQKVVSTEDTPSPTEISFFRVI